MTDPITEDWLKANGFKWHQLDRQPEKHWLLWIGNAIDRHCSYEDLGIEVCAGVPTDKESWFCWLRDDAAGRYHRFVHIRHMRTTAELVALIEAITGHPFDPANALYGSLRTPEDAARIREADARLDRRMNREGWAWGPGEKDETRGGPLPEHKDHHIKTVEQKRT